MKYNCTVWSWPPLLSFPQNIISKFTCAPVPQISEGFRATTNNSEENIVRSIGTFTTKQFFSEKWKTERRMRKSLRLPPHLEWATHFRNKRSIGMKFPHAYAYLPFVSCVKVRRKYPNTPLVCNHLRMTAYLFVTSSACLRTLTIWMLRKVS